MLLPIPRLAKKNYITSLNQLQQNLCRQDNEFCGFPTHHRYILQFAIRGFFYY